MGRCRELTIVRAEHQIRHLLARNERAREMQRIQGSQAGRELARRALQDETIDRQ